MVPDDVGGRYSVLTAVGLLPIAVAGVDICRADGRAPQDMMEVCAKPDCGQPRLAVCRRPVRAVPRRQEASRCWPAYEPAFRFMAEWWKQLYGESEGKEGKGLFPASVEFTADLHSMGQYIQQGERLHVRDGGALRRFPPAAGCVPLDEDRRRRPELPGRARTVDFIRDAGHGRHAAGPCGGRRPQHHPPQAGQINAYTLGELIYFFEYACGLSGYLLDVNPFDQPGVEAYKKNMFALLGKPGYEALRQELAEKLHRA